MDSAKPPALSREPLPPREKPSIFIRVLRFVGAAVVGTLIGVIWVAAHSPRLNRVFRAMVEQQHIRKEEQTAPGANEISKAGPCAQTTIASPEMRKRMNALGGRRRRRANEAPADETTILCMTPMFRDPPDCDALARTYVDAAHPTAPFRISVSKSLRGKAACSVDYDSSGTPITSTRDGGI
jgi:hypothetical protein